MKLSSNTVCAIILGAGKGERAGLGYNKVLFSASGQSVIKMATDKFCFCDQIIVVCPEDQMHLFSSIFDGYENLTLVVGGETRTQSVRNALKHVTCELTLIHDGARPYVSSQLIGAVIDKTKSHGSAIPCIASDVAIKIRQGDTLAPVDREDVLLVQTPQGFRTADIVAAYDKISQSFADDSELFQNAGYKIHTVEGERTNVKLTTPQDFAAPKSKIGTGYDLHRLVENRRLILGGVHIPYEKGLLGHSDADVLTHAVMDAILSALGLPDIGVLFPDDSPETLDACSMQLLSQVMARLGGKKLVNLSAVIMAQKPKLASFIPQIRKSLSEALKLSVDDVNVSATTTEGLGIIGEGNAIAALATVLIEA